MSAADARKLADDALSRYPIDEPHKSHWLELVHPLADELRDALDREERLTVGRATLEDQTNRAELAEARVAALETALRQIAAAGYVKTGAGGFDDPASTTSDPRLEGLADIARAALVLSGGSE